MLKGERGFKIILTWVKSLTNVPYLQTMEEKVTSKEKDD
jgi:hypothetical protein